MAITREAKEQAVATLSDEFSRLKLAVLTDYRGLTVTEIQELRNSLREQGITYRVSKNTLVKLAAGNADNLKDADLSVFKGPMAIAIGFDDEVAPARAVFQFAKEHKALEIVGGIMEDGTTLTAAEVKALAQLPTKDQLRGQLVGTIAAPLSSFVGVLNGNVRSIVTVLAAIGEAKED